MTRSRIDRTARIAVAMLGARRHYAVPVLLERAGLLARLYTDAYAGCGWLRLARPLLSLARDHGNVRRLLRRECGVPAARVKAFQGLGLRYWWRLRAARSAAEREAAYLWVGEAFGRVVSRADWHGVNVMYAFNNAARRVFERGRMAGVRCILDQTLAPRRVYERLLNEEIGRWPEWSDTPTVAGHDALAAEEAAEWRLADMILAGSSFVRDALVASGVAASKCRLVPYGTDARGFAPVAAPRPGGDRLRVLFVGSVGLRKGVPYLLHAARLLGDRVRVRIVGPRDCPARCLERGLPDNTQWVGAVPRGELQAHFAWADVLCLPSLCEGSAGVTYEARAAGLPVICTPNTGATVVDGVDGLVVPIRDSAALAAGLERLARDARWREHLARQAVLRSTEGSWQAYGARLVAAVTDTGRDG